MLFLRECLTTRVIVLTSLIHLPRDKRHQQNALFALLSGDNIRDFVTMAKHEVVLISRLDACTVLCETLGTESTAQIAVAQKLSCAPTEYTVGQHLVIDVNCDGSNEFGQIHKFVSLVSSVQEWIIVALLLHSQIFSTLPQLLR